MKFGIDRLIAQSALRAQLKGRRIALLAHPASVTEDLTHALDALEQAARAREPIGFAAAFGMRAYDPIRQTPRFANVVRAYGIDPAKVGVPSRSR